MSKQSKFAIGQKVKTSNAEVGIIVSKHPVISEAWNIKIERKFGKEIESVTEYYFEEEIIKL